ncbi:unnamed protein product [Ilex paraguariensis]|uniref:Bromo domain-containing protein n=1 Tax=Ilex paraguariensis TaxID=185542 RepID=A0ABC8T9W3_9AQUA
MERGRPSKADLVNRNAAVEQPVEAPAERDLRRSHRRRNVQYILDYDDYIDEDDYYEDEEEVRKKERKLKQLLKLQSKEGGTESVLVRTRRLDHAPTASASSDDDDNKPLKKRKIAGDDENNDGCVDDDDENEIDDYEVRGQKAEPTGADSVPGTLPDPSSGLPLPEKNALGLILNKIQKKDIYGVYAEPPDPEELADYHDVIDHPMDFATVRSKLGNGSYSTLEQFESDVFLICSNAMQYNSPDTIYYKQARSMQELAKRKFQKLKLDFERSEKELKSEQKTRSNSLAKKQIKKPISRTVQEPIHSDFSSGATLATAGDFLNNSNATQAGGCERPSSLDGLVEGNSSLIESNQEKAEDLVPGKVLLPRFGRKLFIHDENRRATYNLSNQPVVGSESIFSTFEGESKQLVPVGLHADHSYARSLARFAATLGPVAWKVASRVIEQALPAGFKFGRGWVGEYEPLPTPVLMLGICTLKGPVFLNSDCPADVRKNDKSSNTTFSSEEHPVKGPILDGKSQLFCPAGAKPTASVGVNNQQRNSQPRNSIEPEKKVIKQVELNYLPSANQSSSDYIAERQISSSSDLPISRSMEMVPRDRNFWHSVSFKQPNNSGVITGRVPHGKVVSNGLDSSRNVSSSSGSFPNQMSTAKSNFGSRQEQGLGDPVQIVRTLAEKAQNQHKSSSQSPVDAHPIVPPVPSLKRDDPSNAAAAAARAWMSIGAGGLKPTAEKNHKAVDSLYNPTRDLQPQVSQFQAELPVTGMHLKPEPLPVRMGNEAQFQNQPLFFPQLVPADLSRFQLQSPGRGPSPQTQPRQKQESIPPDLNIGFQSSGSPVKQSAGVLVDSQHPDLALQL